MGAIKNSKSLKAENVASYVYFLLWVVTAFKAIETDNPDVLLLAVIPGLVFINQWLKNTD